MTEKIHETLKKLAGGTSNGLTRKPEDASGSPSEAEPRSRYDLPGQPDCPHCGGVGYLRQDRPLGHPEFGKLEICTCRHAEVGQQVRSRLFQMSNLQELAHLTFDNFLPRGRVGLYPQQADTLERAYNHAKQYAQSLKGWLLLQGGYGCGKTHLAAAIANFTVSLGVPTLFITVPDLLDTLRFTYQSRETSFEERFDEIRQSPLLILDDFGTQNATPWAQEKLFQILNYRYINHLPVVVTTNLSLDEIEGRIRSRLEDPELVSLVRITAPDYRRPTSDSGYHELSSLSLLHERTLESFDLRQGENLKPEELKSLETALHLARSFAQNPRGWLIFIGNYGCGKTHLAAAIGNFRVRLGDAPILVAVPDLLDYLRATFNPHSTISLDRRFEEVRTARLLILDDLGSQSPTPWVREKLYQLFNYRYNAELPTVITTANYDNEMDPRLMSRMQDTRLCTICPIIAPSYRGSSRKEVRGRPKKK
jgi:DNA replication protein DnaC